MSPFNWKIRGNLLLHRLLPKDAKHRNYSAFLGYNFACFVSGDKVQVNFPHKILDNRLEDKQLVFVLRVANKPT